MAKKLLKDKAWDLFALYIKMRDANGEGLCECVTCGKTLFFYEADCQAGHFVSGRSNAVLFDEKIVHTQCYSCNCGRYGEQAKYLLFMKRKFGYTDEQIEEMLSALSTREREVLHYRFGLEDGHSYTLEEVGRKFGVTRERIRQIEAKALRKLRNPSRKLKDFLD